MAKFKSIGAILSDMVGKVQRKRRRSAGFKRTLSLWLPPLLWMGLIYFLSSRPGLAIGEGAVDFWTRKPAHVGEYAVLFLLLYRAVEGGFGRTWKVWERNMGVSLLAFLYAVSDELHQFFVPLREGKLEDLGFDLLGILVGFLVICYLSNKSPKPRKK